MNSALITISARTIGADEVQTCSARDLHAHLEIKRDFNAWLKEQTQRARLVEGRDFVSYQDVGNPSGGRPRQEYALTIEAAKHIAMLSQTDKGFEVREYFIECERRALAPAADPLATLPPEQRALVALMVEQAETKKRLEIAEDRVSRIEAKQQAFEEGCKYFTVVGYAVWKGLPPVSLSEAATIGKRASKLSAERGVAIDRVRDPRFGMVNSYHESILEAVIEEFLG